MRSACCLRCSWLHVAQAPHPLAAPPLEPTIEAAVEAPAETAEPPAEAAPTVGAMDKVRVVTLPYISFAPFYIAAEEGYFAEQGLEVELVSMAIQAEVLPALVSGQVEVSSGLVSAGIFNTIARGGNIQIVADKGFMDPEGCANHAIIARSTLLDGAEPSTAEQLRGLTVNEVSATWLEYYLDQALEPFGLSHSDVTTVDLPSPTQLDALAQGTIDLTVNNEPWVTRFLQAGHRSVLGSAEQVMPNSQSAIVLYGPSFLGEKAEVGERFMAAYLKAVRQYNEGPTDRNLEIVAPATQLDPALLREICWPALRGDGQLNVESVSDFQAWAVDAGYVEQPVSEEQFWSSRFVDAANEMLGPPAP